MQSADHINSHLDHSLSRAVGTADNRFLDAMDAPKEIIRFLYFADRRAEIVTFVNFELSETTLSGLPKMSVLCQPFNVRRLREGPSLASSTILCTSGWAKAQQRCPPENVTHRQSPPN
jgi:hypothetical protein